MRTITLTKPGGPPRISKQVFISTISRDDVLGARQGQIFRALRKLADYGGTDAAKSAEADAAETILNQYRDHQDMGRDGTLRLLDGLIALGLLTEAERDTVLAACWASP